MLSIFKNSRLKITSPFRNAHLALFLTLLIGAVYLLSGTSCEPGSGATGAAFTTAVVCLAGWLAHLRVGPLRDWRKVVLLTWETIGDLLKFGLAVVLMFLVVSLPFGVEDCFTPRNYVSALLILAGAPREAITERYASRHTLANIGEGLHLEGLRDGDKAWVTRDGNIVLFSAKAGAAVVLTPFVGADGLKWRCSGMPSKHIPVKCRQP